MSGGSYDYTCHEMGEGGVEKFIENVAAMVDDLADLRRRLLADQVTMWNKERGHYKPTAEERDRQAHALAVGIRRMEIARASVEVTRDEMRRLAPLAKAVEWSRSADWGPDDVISECMKP
jgi:hypothetical protein